MLQIDRHRLNLIFDNFNKKRIAVIGDIILDEYFWGKTNRISPEAPVPVVDVEKVELRPGGAANVALNIRSLLGECLMFGIVGDGFYSDQLTEIFKEKKIDDFGVIKDPKRPTSLKTRVLASGQHIVRFDNESCEPVEKEIENQIISRFKERIDSLDGVILEDYNKGVLTPNLIKEIIDLCNQKNIPTFVDPKFNNFDAYQNCYLFKPNLKEAEFILKRKIVTEADIKKAGFDLLELLKARFVVITLSEKGVAIFKTNDDKMRLIPAKSTKIANVSGAGDTVIATLALALVSGAKFGEANTIANYAASVVVEDSGIIPIKKHDLSRRLIQSGVVVSN